MATQANEYFVITDGTTTCTFSDGLAGNTDYRLVDGWAPAVAHLSDSQLGGRGPYQDVTEQAAVLVKGATWTAAKANVGALERLLQQAVRWSRGENVAVVLVKWAPKGSQVATTAAPFQAVVLGGAFAFAQLWTQDQATFQTNGHLTFSRRGAWLLSAAVTASSASVTNPGPYPITGMTSTNNMSPAQIKLAGFLSGKVIDTTDSKPILLMAQQDSDLQIAEAEAASAVAYSIVGVGASNARGGSILRYTPTGTTAAFSAEIAYASATAAARRWAFYAALANNSATTTFKIRVGALIRANATGPVNEIVAFTRSVPIDTATTNPRFVPLGIVSLPGQLRSIQLELTASSPSGTFDVDYVIAQAVDNPYARAVQLDKQESAGVYNYPQVSDLINDPLPLSGLAPSVYRAFETTSDIDVMGYYGDAYPVAASTTFTAAIMCKEFTGNTRFIFGSSASVASLTLTVSRYNAYLVPE